MLQQCMRLSFMYTQSAHITPATSAHRPVRLTSRGPVNRKPNTRNPPATHASSPAEAVSTHTAEHEHGEMTHAELRPHGWMPAAAKRNRHMVRSQTGPVHQRSRGSLRQCVPQAPPRSRTRGRSRFCHTSSSSSGAHMPALPPGPPRDQPQAPHIHPPATSVECATASVFIVYGEMLPCRRTCARAHHACDCMACHAGALGGLSWSRTASPPGTAAARPACGCSCTHAGWWTSADSGRAALRDKATAVKDRLARRDTRDGRLALLRARILSAVGHTP